MSGLVLRFSKQDIQCDRERVTCFNCRNAVAVGDPIRFEYAQRDKATPWCKACFDYKKGDAAESPAQAAGAPSGGKPSRSVTSDHLSLDLLQRICSYEQGYKDLVTWSHDVHARLEAAEAALKALGVQTPAPAPKLVAAVQPAANGVDLLGSDEIPF